MSAVAWTVTLGPPDAVRTAGEAQEALRRADPLADPSELPEWLLGPAGTPCRTVTMILPEDHLEALKAAEWRFPGRVLHLTR